LAEARGLRLILLVAAESGWVDCAELYLIYTQSIPTLIILHRHYPRIDKQYPQTISFLILHLYLPIHKRTLRLQNSLRIRLDLVPSILNDKNAKLHLFHKRRFLNLHPISENHLSSVALDDWGLLVDVAELDCDVCFLFGN
jgi:hypothetical protein